MESYATNANFGITELIRSRLPSGLRMLLLESITIPPPYRDLKMLVFPMDKELIRCLLEQNQSMAPRLRYIFMYYLVEMSEPTDLYDPADEHGMEICGLYKTDVFDPPWEALDSDTYMSRNREVKNWSGMS